MTVRDWLELLIVPLALLVIGFVFTMQQNERQQRIEDQRARQAQKIENQRAEADRELQEQRAQQDTLRAYLDQMGALLLDRDLRTSSENSDVRRLARARTLVVLEALSSGRRSRVLRFLDETGLIQARPPDRPPIISLKYASLRNFQPGGKRLLKGTDLTQATLSGAELAKTDLEGTVLSGAHLEGANLSGANLRDAELSGAYLHDTNLRGADLTGADLSDAKGRFKSGARMSGARLDGADLSGADLANAKITEEQLRQAASLEGATMPNGQRHEEWSRSPEG
jgi:Pentapeptide repeats (8 copies)